MENPCLIKDSAHVGLNDKSPVNVPFVKVKRIPTVCEHLLAKYDVDQAIFNSVHDTKLL